MAVVRKPFVLALTGTSLTTGRLSADWRATLNRELPLQPEAKGPVRVYDLGRGSWTSQDILDAAPRVSALRPTHILFEGGGINDCPDFGSGPVISRAQHILNIQAMYAEWTGAVPGVDLTIHTMNPVSTAGAAIRPALADYYGDEIAVGATLGIRTMDHYAAWPKPLPPELTYDGDGLHPIWTGAVDTYLYPAVLAWARARMAEHWPA